MRRGDFAQILTNRNLGTDGLNRPILENTIYDPSTARVVNGTTYTDPYPSNAIPSSQQDPVALKVQALIPVPTNSALINNYLPTYSNPRLTEIPSVKIDHAFSSSLKLSGYWAEKKTDSPNNSAFPFPIANVQGSHIRSDTIRLNLDYILTPPCFSIWARALLMFTVILRFRHTIR